MTTLALNIIVGPGESNELERCLESIISTGMIDEVVIVCTSGDENVWSIAEKYCNPHRFEWCDDFAAARNCALSHTKSDYVFWMDADDVFPVSKGKAFTRMKTYLTEHSGIDLFFIPYHLEFGSTGEVRVFTQQARIFRNDDSLRWRYPVHEQLTVQLPEHKTAQFKGIHIEHHPVKAHKTGLARNLRILEKNYSEGGTPHTAFYYARDLVLFGDSIKAMPIFEFCVRKRNGNRDNLFTACMELALFHAYGAAKDQEPVDSQIAENYARIALSFRENYAEPFVLLGDLYRVRGDTKRAIAYYKMAMTKALDGMGIQQVPFYEEIPARCLADVYFTKSEIELALYYNRVALSHAPEDKILRENRVVMLNKIATEIHNYG